MSKRSRSSSEAEVELRLNLNRLPASPSPSSSSSSSSSSVSIFGGSRSESGSVENSCLSARSDGEDQGGVEEIITGSMMLVGCPGCFMYVMLTDKSSQCPKCSNNVFLDFFKQQQHHV